MPIKPTVSQLNANSVGILNAIRDNASAEYYQAVPQAKATTESIRAVGEQILAFQPRMNEFVSALVNRIARVVVTSKLYSNPLAFAKRAFWNMAKLLKKFSLILLKLIPMTGIARTKLNRRLNVKTLILNPRFMR